MIRNFRNHQFRILVAADNAARELDVSHVEHVVDPNYRPEKPKGSGHSRRNKGAPKRFNKPAHAGSGNKRQGKKPQAKGKKTHTARRKPSQKQAITS